MVGSVVSTTVTEDDEVAELPEASVAVKVTTVTTSRSKNGGASLVITGAGSTVGGEAARGEMVQPDAVLEVAYGILDLGVAAMVSLQFEQLPVPVGDEAMIAVFGEEGELGTGRRLHPPDDEPYRRGVRLGLEGGAGGLGHIGGTVHPVRNRRPGIFGYRLDEIVQAFVLADGDGVADIHLAADGYHAMSVEPAVGP